MASDGASGRSSSGLITVRLVAIGIIVGVTIFLFFDDMRSAATFLLREMNSNNSTGLREHEEQCDLFNGEWVPNPRGPAYTNNTCDLIEVSSDCLSNGRPDTGYLYWKWKPYGCDVPPFDAEKFINSMRHKSLGFIGDSILRNQMGSLVCMLSKVEEPDFIYHDESYKSRTYYFPSYNFTVATIWAPLLLKYSTSINKELQIHLDTLDPKWTQSYHKYDYVVIATGQWYLRAAVMWEGDKIVGCHNCAEQGIDETGIEYPYRRALKAAFRYITSSAHKPLVFFRTWMPDHFEHGAWYNGGICNRTRPYSEEECAGRGFDWAVRDIEVDEYKKVLKTATENGIRMELLDTFHLSLLRPDGHPGPYRRRHPFDGGKKPGQVQNDCLHFCLPGPVDTWNELMMKKLVDTGIIASSSAHESVFSI